MSKHRVYLIYAHADVSHPLGEKPVEIVSIEPSLFEAEGMSWDEQYDILAGFIWDASEDEVYKEIGEIE